MFHLVVFFVSSIALTCSLLVGTSESLNAGFFGVSLAALLRFVAEKAHSIRIVKLSRIEEIEKMNPSEVMSGVALNIYMVLDEDEDMDGFKELVFELDDGSIISLRCRKNYVINKLERHPGKYRIYYFENILVDVELIPI